MCYGISKNRRNILLDANLEARLADFGLARILPKKNENVSVVAGSYGYIAPEYGYTLKVLMELLTGRKPLDPEFGDSIDIVEWIRGKMRSNTNLEEVLDPSIGTTKYVVEEMLLVLRFAILCTAKLPRDRPSMRDVISMLAARRSEAEEEEQQQQWR